MNINTNFWKRTAERFVKTFLQFYFGFWLLKAGFLDTTVSQAHADAFDLLFTWDNTKAGVVGLALSLATSVGSKPFGSHREDPSVVG